MLSEDTHKHLFFSCVCLGEESCFCSAVILAWQGDEPKWDACNWQWYLLMISQKRALPLLGKIFLDLRSFSWASFCGLKAPTCLIHSPRCFWEWKGEPGPLQGLLHLWLFCVFIVHLFIVCLPFWYACVMKQWIPQCLARFVASRGVQKKSFGE